MNKDAIAVIHGHVSAVADDIARLDLRDRDLDAEILEIPGTIGMPVRTVLIEEAELREEQSAPVVRLAPPQT